MRIRFKIVLHEMFFTVIAIGHCPPHCCAGTARIGRWLENGQQEYFEGPGQGLYAEHPHVLEVALEIFAYPAWHRLVVDNRADPPRSRVEPIPGSFCDV